MIQYAVYVVLSVCCTQYILDSVYAVLGVYHAGCMLYLVLTPDYSMER
jgi:hypothetical protein